MHRYYDIDETNMANLIANTLDIVTNEININKLESLVLAEYTRTVGSPVAMAEPNSDSRSESEFDSNASGKTQDLLKHVRELSVFDFLAWQKKYQHGFIGKGETRVLRDLQNRNIFPDSIINMLTYANLLAGPTVTLAFIETVANDWLQNNINTPELALKRIQSKNYSKYGKPSTTARPKEARRDSNRNRIIEPVPEWYERQREERRRRNGIAKKDDQT